MSMANFSCVGQTLQIAHASNSSKAKQVYDKEKYREMLLEATETVLGYFGFDRTLFGDTSRSKNRKWWHQLREQRQKDIDIERSSNTLLCS